MDNSLLGDASSMILRLDHSFEVGEDPVYSQPVTLDLYALFAHLALSSCEETTLTANQPLSSVRRFEWNLNGEETLDQAGSPQPQSDAADREGSFEVTIAPMQIRTWVCFYAVV